MLKMICFDMDGTIADLYGVKNWEPRLRAEDPSPYEEAIPMCNMSELAAICSLAQTLGIEIRVITWLSKNSTEEYKKAVRNAKANWLSAQGLPIDYFHAVRYGATKADSVRKFLGENETALLIDDNATVRKGWTLGDTLDPTTENIIEVLKGIIENVNS